MIDPNGMTFQQRIDACAAAINAFGETIRQALTGSTAGGGIQPSKPDDDSILIQLSPGYVSWDGGQTWQEERS